MKKLLLSLVSLFLITSTFASDDCSKGVNFLKRSIQKNYPHGLEVKSMEVKKVGNANIGELFSDIRITEKIDVYSVGTTDKEGGYLFIASVDAYDCRVKTITTVSSWTN